MNQPPKLAVALALTLTLAPALPLRAGGKVFGRVALAAATAAIVAGVPDAAAAAAAAPPVSLQAGVYVAVSGAVGPDGGTLFVRQAAALAPGVESGPLQAKVLATVADYHGRNVTPSIGSFDALAQGMSGPNAFRFATKAQESAALRLRLDRAGDRDAVRGHLEMALKLAQRLDRFTLTALEEWHASAGSGRDAVLLERLLAIAEYVGLSAEFEAKFNLLLCSRLKDQLSGRRPLGKGRTRAQVRADKLAVEQCHSLLSAALHQFSSHVIPLVLDLTDAGAELPGTLMPSEAVTAPDSWVVGPPPRDPVEAIEGTELR